MKNYILALSLMLVAISGLTLQSCNRERWSEDDSTIASDNSLTDATADDIFKQADEAATDGTQSLKMEDMESLNGPCATITHDSLSNPRKVTIDFGASNCIGNDGKARRGKIYITYTGRYRDPGTVITIITDKFHVNDNEIILNKTITNKGRNAAGNLFWDIVISNSKIILANNGGTISWDSKRTRTWLAGEKTRILRDNKFEITGSGSGVTRNNVAYTVNITTPVIVDFSCNASRLVKGVIETTPSGKAARIVDFGPGTCDDDATITVGKTTKNFKLKK